jgi:putative transposase
MRKEYINKEIERILRQTAKEHNILVKQIAVAEDHIHVFVAVPFSMSPSHALMLLKGRSSYLIFRKFPNFRLRYRKGHFWSKGKFSRSLSGVTSNIVERYISEQQFVKLHETIQQAEAEQHKLLDYL